jgi:hypothetical protein
MTQSRNEFKILARILRGKPHALVPSGATACVLKQW